MGGKTNNGGTVFELIPPTTAGGTWTEEVLYSFSASYNTPHNPYGGVTIGPNGALFGTTFVNAINGITEIGGTVFMLAPPTPPSENWTERTLQSFWPQTSMGVDPFTGVILRDGSLYGTTYLSNIVGRHASQRF